MRPKGQPEHSWVEQSWCWVKPPVRSWRKKVVWTSYLVVQTSNNIVSNTGPSLQVLHNRRSALSDATSNLHFESLPLRARFRQLRGRMPMIEAIALASRSDVGVDVPCTYNTIIYTYIITSPSSASTCPHLTAPISYHIFHSACRKKIRLLRLRS